MKNNFISVKDYTENSVIIFSKSFKLNLVDSNFKLDITSIGLYKVFINNQEITNRKFTPGITSYDFRLMYQTYEVSKYLKQGENSIEIYVAPGWAVGHYGLYNFKNWISDRVFLNLSLYNKDNELFHSDETFKARESFILMSDIYNGEIQDYTKKEFKELAVVTYENNITLVPNEGEDVIEQEILSPIKLIVTPKNERIIDFGQNMTGYICLKSPKEGQYQFNFCEVLDKYGNFYNENYRGILNTIQFNIDKHEIKEVKPWFSFQGFRYVLIEKWPDNVEIDLDKIKAIVVHSNIERLSYFKCGNEMLNKLYSNIIWGQKGNFLDIPTDCPQRDERLGWLGDAQVFSKTACYNFKCDKFFRKWLKDVALEQTKEGAIRGFVPHVLKDNYEISSGWGDACAIVPYEVYDAYGDKEILKENLSTMSRWIEYMKNTSKAENLWIGHFAFGDWLGMDLPAGSYDGATQKDFISSAYFYRTTKLVAKIEEILNIDNSYHLNLAKDIKKAFRSYFMKDGMPVLNYEKNPPNPNKGDIAVTQTSLSMLLMFGLYEGEKERVLIAKKLNELVINNGTRLNTGFLGTPLLLYALSENGYEKTAIDLLFQDKFPSWFYSIKQGATTIWEHWDGMNEQGEFWSKDMNSFNHYSYGAVLSWIIENVVGLKRLEPGFKKIKVMPIFDNRVGDIEFTINTVNGNIKISHQFIDGKYHTEVNIDPRIELIR